MYKEKLEALKNAVETDNNSKMIIQRIEECVSVFGSYIKHVVDMEAAMQFARFRLEGEEYRDYVERLDRQRTVIHDAALVNCNIVNRMAVKFLGEEIFPNAANMHRSEVADTYIKVVVDEYFEARKK